MKSKPFADISSLSTFSNECKVLFMMDCIFRLNIGNLYNWIGENYRGKRALERAFENYNKSIELFRNANDEDHPDMDDFYNNIASVYYDQKNNILEQIKFASGLKMNNLIFPKHHNLWKQTSSSGFTHTHH